MRKDMENCYQSPEIREIVLSSEGVIASSVRDAQIESLDVVEEIWS